MAGRRTNLALALAVIVALGTGIASFQIGTASGRAVVVGHGVFSLALIVLSPAKSLIARRGLARPRRGRMLSVALAGAAAMTILTGMLFSTGLVLRYGPLSAMQVHVGSAVALALLVAAHMITRPVRPRTTDVSRRNLLRLGSVSAAGGFLWLAVEGTGLAAGWRGASRRFTGSHEQGSFEPTEMPVTQWLNDAIPHLGTTSWQLRIDAGEARLLTYGDLMRFDDQVTATLDCTGGWYSSQLWTGVRLSDLMGPLEAASIRVVSHTGYERRLPVQDLHRVFLAHSVGDVPLSPGHGAPARLVVPGRRGFWWVKWVMALVADERPAWWQLPFPTA